jgi:glyoxylase-like metal-dependent hydrolase (beta-lactamase superfamily II)
MTILSARYAKVKTMLQTPPVTQIASDIYQVQLPLPFALRIVNCYLLRGDEGWMVIDTGLHTAEGEAGWRAAFESLDIQPGDLRQIVVTHHHPDHYGMAGWLLEWNGVEVPVWMSERERGMVERVWWQADSQSAEFSTLMRRAGVGADMLDGMLRVTAEVRERTRPQVTSIQTIAPGDWQTFGGRQFRILNGPGHSVAQVLLYDQADKLLFCADHVLMKITPNVGIWPGSDDDPLASFLASLREMSSLDVRLALPGHRTVIHDWRGRLAELEQHHDERLAHVAAAARGGASALQVAETIFAFQNFTYHEMRFAVAEALAHLEYLHRRGELRRDEAGEVWTYRTS